MLIDRFLHCYNLATWLSIAETRSYTDWFSVASPKIMRLINNDIWRHLTLLTLDNFLLIQLKDTDNFVDFSWHLIHDLGRNKETKFSFWVGIKWKSKTIYSSQLCLYGRFMPVTNGVIYSSRLSYMEDFTPVTNSVIYSSRLSYMEDFTPVTNSVISSSQ